MLHFLYLPNFSYPPPRAEHFVQKPFFSGDPAFWNQRVQEPYSHRTHRSVFFPKNLPPASFSDLASPGIETTRHFNMRSISVEAHFSNRSLSKCLTSAVPETRTLKTIAPLWHTQVFRKPRQYRQHSASKME